MLVGLVSQPLLKEHQEILLTERCLLVDINRDDVRFDTFCGRCSCACTSAKRNMSNV